MDKEQFSPGQSENVAISPAEEGPIDLDSTHQVARTGQKVLELSKELNSSSKALLEQIEPIV